MSQPFRGIYPVLQTAFLADGTPDEDVMRRQVDFCLECGAHGLVFPVLGSEFQFLTNAERHRLVELVVAHTDGRAPVVAGVAGPSAPVAAEHAAQASGAGAAAVIALPPYLAAASRAEIRAYYAGIAAAARIPVFIQHSQPGMDPPFLAELLHDIDQVLYVKEEMHPSAHQISGVLERVGPECLGVFGGAHGRWMLSELERGACGFMPAAEAVDVHVQIWEAFAAGDRARARRRFNELLPLINLVLLLGLRLCKEVLVRRGVFTSAAMRQPGVGELDAADRQELDQVLDDLGLG